MYIPVPLLIGFGLAFVVLLALAFARRSGGRRDLIRPPAAAAAARPAELPPELEAQVRVLMAERRKIDAIRLIRAQTGVDLKSAKEAAERMG